MYFPFCQKFSGKITMYVARSIVFSERFEVDLLKLASFSSTCYTCRELFFIYSLIVLLVIIETLKHTVLFLMSPFQKFREIIGIPFRGREHFRVNYACFPCGETKNFRHLRYWLTNLLTYLA